MTAALLAIAFTAEARSQGLGNMAEPKYLMFQLFTAGPGFSTEASRHAISSLPDPGFLDAQAKQILDAVGERGDERHRLGVIVGPLALDHTDAQLRTLVERTFAIAAKYRIAVGFHIDDSKFWANRRDLWNNPDNVESLDWKGTPNTGQYLNWGEAWKLAPQACFNSPAMLAEARRIAGKVIGPAITEQLGKLRKADEQDLFAGVIVGWETAIGRDYDTRQDLGYRALANLGFSAAKPPPDADQALEGVVRNWIGAWSGSLADAGVPQGKIYSHIAFISHKQYNEGSPNDGSSYSRSVMFTPPAVAFGATHRPGFSAYPDAGVFGDIYQALNAHANPAWASAEGTNVDINSGPPRIPDEGMEDYLARMFNHGATITNVFGWGIGDPANPFRRATESADAIAAYRKFLHGDRLSETPLSQAYGGGMSALQTRTRALPGRIQAYQQAGGDMGQIMPRVKRLERDMQDGQLEAMTRELDLIDETLDVHPAISTATSGFNIAALQQKMHALPQKIDTFQQHGGDMRRLKARVVSIQSHIAAGELQNAFEELEALDPILQSP